MKKLIALVFALVLGTTSVALADDASDTKAQIQALQAQLDAVKAQLDRLQAQQQRPPARPAPGPPAERGTYIQKKPGDALTFTNGGSDEVTLYGNLDLSIDHTTKGLQKFYPSSGDTPIGNTSYQSAVSTNLSYIGVRGLHKLGKKSNVVYQLETQLDISSTAGTVYTNSNNDNVVKGALTSRNSFLGLSTPIGTFRVGKTDAPYKNSTQRMNPFSGELGDYSVIMGNSGGDNRVEFGTRLDHAIWYDSPASWGPVTLSLLVAPGQNRSSDNGITASGEVGCAGGNAPGSGAGAPLCNDGSFSSAYSIAGTWTNPNKRFYWTGAYEIHKSVNRMGDLAGDPRDIGDEQAWKTGFQWQVSKGTTLNAIYEELQRNIPVALQFQNERQRSGYWFALTQNLDRNSNVNFGWAHANASPGDLPQHNTPAAGANPDNSANLYTIAYKHNLDRHFSWYVDWALTLNHPDAHYDLGAGGRGLTTDCHDGSPITGFDPTVTPPVSGVGPRCYTGGRLQGFSSGLKFQF
ncbi:MAG: Porin precursor [Candidatus Eremiobacteraeota bacterium]|nr:Porin precursor [Candidatus Eremiobacteraeota bacterium]